ncbi:hypothetical protein DY000_02005710 [Brassica cretica]|uniref:FBD domain-containing protein n=1 Tax=Brassica cretica TaxID=69181 RepID=A0ABQ7C939_BRACR|nr:hypothetical protein DY000_02005710 [Brassica cretica]
METTVFLQRYKPFASSKDKNITYLVHPLKPQTSIKKALSSPISLSLTSDSLETIPDCIKSLSRLIELDIRACEKLVALPPLPGSLLSIDAGDCESLKRIDPSFQNPNICLNFSHCINLNQEARNLIHASACKDAFLLGEEVLAHFTHGASSGSLTINSTPTLLPSSFRFKAWILLSEGYFLDDTLVDVSVRVRSKQNGLIVGRGSTQLHIPYLPRYEEHLYIFEDSCSLNQASNSQHLAVKVYSVQLVRNKEKTDDGGGDKDESGDEDEDDEGVMVIKMTLRRI